MKITPFGSGYLFVAGFGRVGSYEAARKARRCRSHKYWAITEFMGPGKGFQERPEFGKHKTKKAANEALLAYAIENNLKAESFGKEPDINSYIGVQLV